MHILRKQGTFETIDIPYRTLTSLWKPTLLQLSAMIRGVDPSWNGSHAETNDVQDTVKHHHWASRMEFVIKPSCEYHPLLMSVRPEETLGSAYWNRHGVGWKCEQIGLCSGVAKSALQNDWQEERKCV